MSSVGLENPISGSFKSFIPQGQGRLGKGINGFIPQAVTDTNNFDEYAQIRFTLRQAWNNTYPSQLKKSNVKRIITPFRAINNAGDILCREYYSCGGPCQTFQNRPGLFGLRGHFGAIHSHCDGTSVPPSACNTKYVYDSSDYITYLRNNAINKNYNDYSNGGDDFNTSQSSIRHVRRF
jgi:hypothetical protein